VVPVFVALGAALAAPAIAQDSGDAPYLSTPPDTTGVLAVPARPETSASSLAPSPGDTADVAPVPAPSDTAGVDAPPAPGDTTGATPDALLGGEPVLEVLPEWPDSTAGDADSLDARSPQSPPRDPYAIGVRAPEKLDDAFLRPWNLMWRRGRGLGPERPRLPRRDPSGTPFKRELTVDLDNDRIVIVTRVGQSTVWTSYVSSIDEYQRRVREDNARSGWEDRTVQALGRRQETRERGLLDIDIPMPLPGPVARAIGTGANLKVRGSERITFGGTSRWSDRETASTIGSSSRFPQLQMQQQLNVNLEGTIGSKIHVYVNHSSVGESFGAAGKTDQIRVNYEGDEDEIIQMIELGEVNLSLPGTKLVSGSSGHQGLFGAKMTAKLGRLDLTAVASKQEGKTSSASYTGSSESDELQIKDIAYKARTYFIIDEQAFRDPDISVRNVLVYLDDRVGDNNTDDRAKPGTAYLRDPNGASEPDALPDGGVGPLQEGQFAQLVIDEDFYIPDTGGVFGQTETGLSLGAIALDRPIQDGRVLAVYYERVEPDTIVQVGGPVYDDDGKVAHLFLKLIRQYYSGSEEWAPTRLYELKHIYDLGAGDIPRDGFDLTIRRKASEGQDPEVDDDGNPYTRILGLDQESGGVGASPVDEEWLFLTEGLLVFPHYTPFCPGYADSFYYKEGEEPDTTEYADEFDESERNCLVYSRERFEADDDEYYLVLKYSRPKTTFNLKDSNIIEGSEVVRLNGVQLTRGTDYTIYYPSGQLTILAEGAKDPQARVTVDYDYKPFFGTGEKTLLGTRAVYNWSDNIRLGTTWMYESKGSPDDRPRLGEEPSRTIVGDVNLKAEFSPELLTTLADAIPLIDTDAQSSLEISAEAAVSIPNPNTRGFVAIDDMEGVDNVSSLGMSMDPWVPASVPVPNAGSVKAANREKIYWYNPRDNWDFTEYEITRKGDLFPFLGDEEAREKQEVLTIRYENEFADTTWAGLMKSLSRSGNDYSDYSFFEFWVNGGSDPQGEVRIDLGTISEKFYPLHAPDDSLHTEDTDVPPDGNVRDSEDTGLDGIPTPSAGDDPDDDHFIKLGETTPSSYLHVNGTEGNRRLDTEDLNRTQSLDVDNRYWSLTIDLRDTSDTSYFVKEDNNWRLYRVPLRDAEATPAGGISSWFSIESARIWFKGLSAELPAPPGEDEPKGLRIGGMDIVGTQWKPVGVVDAAGQPQSAGTLRLGSKNNKEDRPYLDAPPFPWEEDPDTREYEREQSLFMKYEDVGPGLAAVARKVLLKSQDYTGYRAIEFYLHGGDNDDENGVEDLSNTEFFLRIGHDESNYYEYRTPIEQGWSQEGSNPGDNKFISLPFTYFTKLKLEPDDQADAAYDTIGVRRIFGRVGSPSLSNISTLSFGVVNTSSNDEHISGEIWLDDINLSDVRSDMGHAESVTVEARIADLAVINASMDHTDSEFHTLGREWGSGRDAVSYRFNGTVNIDRFVSGLGITAPVNVVWERTTERPRLKPNSDIELDSSQSDDLRTDRLKRSVAISLSRKRQSSNYWTHLLFDNLSVRGSVSQSESKLTEGRDTTRIATARVSYRYTPEKVGIPLLGATQLFLKPSSIHMNADVKLQRARKDIFLPGTQEVGSTSVSHEKNFNADAGVNFQLLDNLGTSHSISFRRDLEPINRILYGINTGVETQRNYSNSLTFNPKVGSWLSPQYSFSSSFSDNHGPEVRREGDPFGIRNVRGQSTQEVSTSFDLKKLLGPGSPRRVQPPRADRTDPAKHQSERASPPEDDNQEIEEDASREERGRPPVGPGREGPEMAPRAPAGSEEPTAEEQTEDAQEMPLSPDEQGPSESIGLDDLARPVMSLLRNLDAVKASYSIRKASSFRWIAWDELPGWGYRLGLVNPVGADDSTYDRTLTLDSGINLTSDVRVKGSYKKTNESSWQKNVQADSTVTFPERRREGQTMSGSLSWGGIHKLAPLSGMFSSIRATSGVKIDRGSRDSQDQDEETRGFAMNPIVSVDATFKNGLQTGFSWNRSRNRTFRYDALGTGSATESQQGSLDFNLKYRFSAPQGLKLPFFGEKVRFQSNLDTSLTIGRSTETSRVASDEAGLEQVDPKSSTENTTGSLNLTYGFSRNVSGSLRVDYRQKRDLKSDSTNREVGVHLSAEFKF
jgi:hypothetical protein